MPELPEAEVVRRGLERWTVGRRVETVEVLDPRSLRRHIGGPGDLVQRLQGGTKANLVGFDFIKFWVGHCERKVAIIGKKE